MAVQEDDQRIAHYRAVSDLQASMLAKDVAEMLHASGVMPKRFPPEITQEAIRKCLSARTFRVQHNPLSCYVSLRRLTRYVSGSGPDGILMSREDTALFNNAFRSRPTWRLEEVFTDVYQREVLRDIARNSTAHWAIQDHYEKRRKKANAALANKVLRQQVFDRHGEACLKCGDTNNLAIDHIVPVALGGTDDLDNLQVLCRSCNSSKGSNLEVQETMPNLGTIAGSCDTCGDTTLQVTRVDDNGDPTEGFCIPCNQPEGAASK